MKKKIKLLTIALVIIIVIILIIAFFFVQKKKNESWNIKTNNSNKNNKIAIILEKEDGNIESKSFPENDGTYVFDKIMCNNLASPTTVLPTWDNENWRLKVRATSNSNIDGQFNCDIYFKEYEGVFNKDTSGANPPILRNRIPIYYDETEGMWRITTTKQVDWYNYDEQKWANSFSINPARQIDYSGNCNYGSIKGEPTREADYMSFDGTDDYITTEVNPPSGIDITLSARVQVVGATARGDIISNFETGGIGIMYIASNNKFAGQVYVDGAWRYVYSNAISQNTWYTVTFTYDGTNLKIYLNGELNDTLYFPGDITASDKNLFVGAQPQGTSSYINPFKGYISHAIIYQKALTEWQIEDYFSSGNFDVNNNPTPYPSDALAYYIFDRSEMYGEKVKGMPITLSCGTKGLWVWIPRFKYAVPAGTNEREISVIFENGTAKTGTNNVTGAQSHTLNNLVDSDYYTHPGFTYKGVPTTPHELIGLWVGKFQSTFASINPLTAADNKVKDNVFIRPSYAAAVYQRAYWVHRTALAVDTSHDLTTSFNTRVIKGKEFASIIALTMSKYGKYGNSDYTGANKEVYFNNSTRYITGRSAGVPYVSGGTKPTRNEFGTYNYDNGTVSTSNVIDSSLETRMANCSSNGTGCKGTGASSTGNIYGVYDMSGGAYEMMFSIYTGSATVFDATSTTTGTGFTTDPSSIDSYFDLYDTISKFTNGALGEFKGDFIKNRDGTEGWYGDGFVTISSSSPFRSGSSSYSAENAGIFTTYCISGNATANVSYRIVQPTIQ